MIKGNAKLMKSFNKFNVTNCIINEGPLSCEEIVKKTNLSRPTVVEILKEVLNENLISKIGIGEYAGGRIPVLYGIEPMGRFALAIDFEYPKVKIAIINFANDIIIDKTFYFVNGAKPSAILDKLLHEVDALIDSFEYQKEKIIGICVALPGIINSNNGMSVKIERIADWVNVPVKEIFEQRYGIETLINNDVHIMAFFQRKLYSNLPDDFIYIGVRFGIGMAVVRADGFDSGCNGNAGFLGHTTISMDGPKCVCGKTGCLESYSGELALIEKYRCLSGLEWDFSENAYDILLRQAKEGDKAAHKLLKEAFKGLAIGAANAIKIIDVQTIVIDGFSTEKFFQYFNYFRELITNYLYEELHKDLQILWYAKDSDMAVKACGYYIFSHYIKSILEQPTALGNKYFLNYNR